jgi:hypothetical protein
MKQFLLFISTFLFLHSSIAQVYFNKRYNLSEGENGLSILQDSSNYVAVIGTYSPTALNKLQLIKLDSTGNILWNETLESTTVSYYAGGPGCLVKLLDGGFVIGGGIVDTSISNDPDATLYIFDKYGDTLWTKAYGDSVFQTFYQCNQTSDSGFICTGETCSNDIYGNALLVKTDKLGNVIWQKEFGLNGKEEYGESVIQTSDGGYFIGGKRYTPSTENGDFMLIKTDSFGNVTWQKFLGGAYDDFCSAVLEASDGNLVAAGGLVAYDSLPHGGLPFGQPYVVKYDTAGNLLWETLIGPIKFLTAIYSISETVDENLIGAGITFDDSGFYAMGLVVKLNDLGDSLFYNTYRNIYGHDSGGLLCDLKQTNDNGYIAIGWIDPYAPDTGDEDSWILKLDSNGCEIANCLYTSSEDSKDLLQHFVCYPNPTSNKITIEIPSELLNQKVTVRIYDLSGRQLELFKIDPDISKFELDLRSLSPGIYFAYFRTDSGIVGVTRIIKN